MWNTYGKDLVEGRKENVKKNMKKEKWKWKIGKIE